MKTKDYYWKKRKVLVTGYEGFVGSWLTKNLISYGAKVIGIDKVKNRPLSVLTSSRKSVIGIKGNVSNLSLIKETIVKYKPQIIFHLAAQAIVGRANKNPLGTFKSNIEGTWNILEVIRDKEFIEAVIIASSDKAYGDQKQLPYKESAPLKGSHPYDVSKSCADLLTYTYYNTYKVPVCVVRCGNIYGPGDFHFSRIVPDTIKSALSDKILLIRSDGKFTRDYIYVEDIIQGYLLLAQKMEKLQLFGEAFNLSNEKPVPVLELVKTIYKLCGKKPKYRILCQAKAEIRDQYLSSWKAKRILGWEPEYSLEKGLKKTINWYEKTTKI